MNIKLDVQVVHAPGVIKNLPDKEVHGTLVRKPETQWVTAQVELVKKFHKQNARPERHQKPEDQHVPQEFQGFFPVGLTVIVMLHESSSIY
jgi:hypothetical protein